MAGIHRLSARALATAKTPGLHADGGGLYLQVILGAGGVVRRSWLFGSQLLTDVDAKWAWDRLSLSASVTRAMQL